MREFIVVDVETTGLHEQAAILEVAAINMTTGDELHFVPYIIMRDLAHADRKALQINRYYERGVFERELNPADTNRRYEYLRKMLDGNTLGGSNPTFDAKLLSGALHSSPWHHRLADLSAYAAGVLGIPLTELPGLEWVCSILNVVNDEPHSAMGDARATAECFRILNERSRP